MNFIISGFGTLINSVFGLLPQSPFSAISNSGASSYFGTLAWFIPISSIVAISQAWLACILLYYGYSVILRWVKLIT